MKDFVGGRLLMFEITKEDMKWELKMKRKLKIH